MKKTLIYLFCLAFVGANAQEGKVGIATEAPTEQLDVSDDNNGGLRVRNLPQEGDTLPSGETYTPTSIVIADANGVLGSVPPIVGDEFNIEGYLYYKVKYTNVLDWPTAQTNFTPFRVDTWMPIVFVSKMSSNEGVARVSSGGRGKAYTNTKVAYDREFFNHWHDFAAADGFQASPVTYSGNFTVTLKSTDDYVWTLKPADSPTGVRQTNAQHAQYQKGQCVIGTEFVNNKTRCVAEYGEIPAYWAFHGDIAGLGDTWDFTVIFLNKKFIAAEENATLITQ